MAFTFTPRHLSILFITLSAFALITGCSTGRDRGGRLDSGAAIDGAPTDGASPDTSTPIIPGAITLGVLRAWQGPEAGAVSAGAGRIFDFVEVTLTNGLAEPLFLTSTLFSLQTAGGLSFPGHPATAGVFGSCPSEAQLEPGSVVTCVVAFEVGDADAVTTIRYTPPTGEPATAPVSVEPCVRCGGECVDLTTSSEHCGACYRAIGRDLRCEGGEPVCDSGGTPCLDQVPDSIGVGLVIFECVDSMSSSLHCGTCGSEYLCGATDRPEGTSCEDSSAVCFRGGEASMVVIRSEDRVSSETLCSRVGGVAQFGKTQWVHVPADSSSPIVRPGSPDEVPPATYMGAAFRLIECWCDLT